MNYYDSYEPPTDYTETSSDARNFIDKDYPGLTSCIEYEFYKEAKEKLLLERSVRRFRTYLSLCISILLVLVSLGAETANNITYITIFKGITVFSVENSMSINFLGIMFSMFLFFIYYFAIYGFLRFAVGSHAVNLFTRCKLWQKVLLYVLPILICTTIVFSIQNY